MKSNLIHHFCRKKSGWQTSFRKHATLGNVRGGTVSKANGGVERSETFLKEDLP